MPPKKSAKAKRLAASAARGFATTSIIKPKDPEPPADWELADAEPTKAEPPPPSAEQQEPQTVPEPQAPPTQGTPVDSDALLKDALRAEAAADAALAKAAAARAALASSSAVPALAISPRAELALFTHLRDAAPLVGVQTAAAAQPAPLELHQTYVTLQRLGFTDDDIEAGMRSLPSGSVDAIVHLPARFTDKLEHQLDSDPGADAPIRSYTQNRGIRSAESGPRYEEPTVAWSEPVGTTKLEDPVDKESSKAWILQRALAGDSGSGGDSDSDSLDESLASYGRNANKLNAGSMQGAKGLTKKQYKQQLQKLEQQRMKQARAQRQQREDAPEAVVNVISNPQDSPDTRPSASIADDLDSWEQVERDADPEPKKETQGDGSLALESHSDSGSEAGGLFESMFDEEAATAASPASALAAVSRHRVHDMSQSGWTGPMPVDLLQQWITKNCKGAQMAFSPLESHRGFRVALRFSGGKGRVKLDGMRFEIPTDEAVTQKLDARQFVAQSECAEAPQTAKAHENSVEAVSKADLDQRHRRDAGDDPAKLEQLLEARKKSSKFMRLLAVIDAVSKHQVVVLSGDTGSGKSTQVPQFLLEHAISAGYGTSTNIICTQPRRISAMSLAQRVSEEIADPGQPGARGTWGVLLRRMESDPLLSGVSHVVVDEVHERTLDSDFLLFLLKRLIPKRPDLRIVLMSATADAAFFAAFFEKNTGIALVPALQVPGKAHPVEIGFLEDAVQQSGYTLDAFSEFALQPKAAGRESRMITVTGRGGKSHRQMVVWEKTLSRADADDLYVDDEEDSAGQDGDAVGAVDRADAGEKAESQPEYSAATLQAVALTNPRRINFELIEHLIYHILATEPPQPQDAGDQPGSILVFLPGMAEIRRVKELLDSRAPDRTKPRLWVLCLHGLLSGQEQSLVFQSAPAGLRKVVLSTNVAETGVTIPDVVYVIDSGRAREVCYDERRKMRKLAEVLISKANCKQRAGRAGRVRPGKCFHLMPRATYDNLTQALDDNENLTQLGTMLANLPLDVRLGKMLLYAAFLDCLEPQVDERLLQATLAASLYPNLLVLDPVKRARIDEKPQPGLLHLPGKSDAVVIHRSSLFRLADLSGPQRWFAYYAIQADRVYAGGIAREKPTVLDINEVPGVAVALLCGRTPVANVR
nr:ATP-dependent RNA helicase dhx29 [Polyrhizophydium stewartii]